MVLVDEIKAAEQSKMQQLISESNLERDNTIQVLQQELKSWEGVSERMKTYIDRQQERMNKLEV